MRHSRFWHRIALFTVVYLGGLALAVMADADPMRAPKREGKPPQTTTETPLRSLPKGVFDRLLRFYQQVISEVDGARSNMYPTGSDYARRVIKKHGVALGIVLTAERLLHEGNEKQVSPRIRKYGIWRIYDPVEANDWWWRGSENWVYQPRVPQR